MFCYPESQTTTASHSLSIHPPIQPPITIIPPNMKAIPASISYPMIIDDHVDTLMSLFIHCINPTSARLAKSISQPLNYNLASFASWLCWHNLALHFSETG